MESKDKRNYIKMVVLWEVKTKMMMDVCVKIPQEAIEKAMNEVNCGIKCLRKEITFKLFGDQWKHDITCGRYGNGYGTSFTCKENCPLRITDLSKAKQAESKQLKGYTFLIQEDYYRNHDDYE